MFFPSLHCQTSDIKHIGPYGPFLYEKPLFQNKNSFMTPFFYSVLLSSYFSKYWGDGCMGRLPTTNLGGDHPPVPLSLHPCLICLLLSLYMYFCKIFKFPYFGKMLKCPPPMFVHFRFFASPYLTTMHVCV